MFYAIVFFIAGYLFTKIIIPMFILLLTDANCLRNNYKNEKIPVGMGLIFVPTIVCVGAIIILISPEKFATFHLALMLGVLAMGLAGLIDDLLGNRTVTGLKGHFKAFFKGRLTTGGFKAIFGGLMAMLISIVLSDKWADIGVNTLLIALFTNFINLLDLRPGRALKGFFISGIILILLNYDKTPIVLFSSLLGSASAYIPYDLKAKSMMGDVGSNILGISLGVMATAAELNIRIILLILLILVHLYTEKYSLTRTIEKNKFLKFIDNLGR